MLEKAMGIKPKTETDAKAGVTKRPAKAVAATTADPAVTALIRGAVVDNSVAAELLKAETMASLTPKSTLGCEWRRMTIPMRTGHWAITRPIRIG